MKKWNTVCVMRGAMILIHDLFNNKDSLMESNFRKVVIALLILVTILICISLMNRVSITKRVSGSASFKNSEDAEALIIDLNERVKSGDVSSYGILNQKIIFWNPYVVYWDEREMPQPERGQSLMNE